MPEPTLQLALDHHRAGRLALAEEAYRALLARNPDDADALHWLAVLAHHVGQAEEAVGLARRAAALRPDDAEIQHNLGHICLTLSQTSRALAAFERATQLRPGLPEPWFGLGITRQLREDLVGALAALDRAGTLGLDTAEFQYHRAVALLSVGRVDDAIAAGRRALQHRLDFPQAHHILAAALNARGNKAEARGLLLKALELNPKFARACHSLAVLEAEAGRLEEALNLFRRALAINPDYVAARDGLVAVQEKLGTPIDAPVIAAARGEAMAAANLHEAVARFEEKQRSMGDLDEIRFMLAMNSGFTPPDRVPRHSLATMFDRYAERFDQHLVEKLDYHVPEMMIDAVAAARPGVNLRVMDLGCGTGLCGPLFRPIAAHLAGVDLSPAMVEKARERNIYDELAVGDIVEALKAASEKFDLILAADVFVYVGELGPVFGAAAETLKSGGLFTFSVESGVSPRFHLQRNGRYTHSANYLRTLAAAHGFQVESFDDIMPRTEYGKPVTGFLVVLRASQAAG